MIELTDALKRVGGGKVKHAVLSAIKLADMEVKQSRERRCSAGITLRDYMWMDDEVWGAAFARGLSASLAEEQGGPGHD